MDTTMLKSSIDLWKERRELSKKSEKALWGGDFSGPNFLYIYQLH